MKRRRWMAGVLAGTPLVVMGCTGSADTPTLDGLPTEAPSVPRALDASSYLGKPCDLFTDEQSRAAGFPVLGESYEDVSGAYCSRGGDGDSTFRTHIVADDLLGKVYRREVLWPADVAESTMVGGQPAVRATRSAGEPCLVVVGLGGKQAFEVRIVDKRADPCGRATGIAEAIVLKVAAGPRKPDTAPLIPRPLSAAAFRDKPCELFADEQAKEFGYGSSTPMMVNDQSYCVRQGEGRSQFVIRYHHDGTDRFGKIMRREDEKAARWAVTRVADQPAVQTRASNCRLVVGLSDTESVAVEVGTCEQAAQVAEAVVRKLGG